MSEHTQNLVVPQDRGERVSESREDQIVKGYLCEHEPIFRDLFAQKNQGWASPEGDKYFEERRRITDNAGPPERKKLYNMTKRIGDDMNEETKVFDLRCSSPLILDLCMAPGGFSASSLKRFPYARVHAITLSPEDGGHPVVAKHPSLTVTYADITLYAADFGVTEIPVHHPGAALFSQDRPYLENKYDLIFCGGTAVRTQKRADYRQFGECTRLTTSQLIFAFQRLKPGGTLVLLLHKVDACDTVRILHAFDKFSKIKLFKPSKTHNIKSTFYLVAQSVESQSAEALKAVETWKTLWYESTFGPFEQTNSSPGPDEAGSQGDQEVTDILKEFGLRLVQLGRPIWKIQAQALTDLDIPRPGLAGSSWRDRTSDKSTES